MKILYLVDVPIPNIKANAYQTVQMCDALSSEENEVLLISVVRDKKKITGTIDEYYRQATSFEHSVFNVPDFIGYFEKNWLTKNVVKIQHIASLLTTLVFAGKSRVRIRELNPDIIYVRSYYLFIFLMCLSFGAYGQKLIFEVHNINRSRIAKILLVVFSRYCKQLVCVTTFLARDLVGLGVEDKKISIAPDAFDHKRFQPIKIEEARHCLNLPKNRRIFGFVGMFHTNGQEKGIPEIIQSAKIITSTLPDCLFMFVGGIEGEYDHYFEQIRNNDLDEKNFLFVSRKSTDLVPYYMAACDILLMPHPKTHFYSFYVSPLKMFEYMSMKKPIIASDLPAIREILVHEKTAILVEAENTEEIALAILKLVRDECLSKNISNAAFKEAQRHTWESRAAKISEGWKENKIGKIKKFS